MKPGSRSIALTALLVLAGAGLALSAPPDAASRGTQDATPAPQPRIVLAQAALETDRGCCIFQDEGKAKCAYGTRGYCATKASQAKVSFEFQKDKSCSEVPACQ